MSNEIETAVSVDELFAMANKEITQSPVTLIAYHADCIDGFTAAWVTAKFLDEIEEVYELVPMEYNQASYDQLWDVALDMAAKNIYVVDFSLPNELIAKFTDSELNPYLQKLTILDHHKTAFERYCPTLVIDEYSNATITGIKLFISLHNGMCGALLCFNHFSFLLGEGESAPKLLRYVDDYDRWIYQYGDDTKYLNKYIRTLPMTIESWDHLADQVEDKEQLALLLEVGKELQEKHDREVERLTATSWPIELAGVPGLAVYCDYEYASDVGHALAVKSNTYGCTIQILEDREVDRYSLRSYTGSPVDVSLIAQAYGGGGHRNAAGFEATLSSTKVLVE